VVSDAVIVAFPGATNVAVLPEKVTTEVLLDVQVVLPVTSAPFRVAENVALVPLVNVVPLGTELIVNVCELPPVTVPVAAPPTPPSVAVIVRLDVAPTPVTIPLLTVAQALLLVHTAELVTSFEPEL
jgi:hypothetical protein